MDLKRLEKQSDYRWQIPQSVAMRVPGLLFASEPLLREMDDKVYEQLVNVAQLPGIVGAACAMPDAHWGYGFPIGGVAAFDPEAGGVVSAGGVGFDISCGVRLLHTGLMYAEVLAQQAALAEALYLQVPAGLGSRGRLHLSDRQMDDMLQGGAQWAVAQGYGEAADLERIEEHGCMAGADPSQISQRAKTRQRDEMGTLGSGNHYLEVQRVVAIYDQQAAAAFGLFPDQVKVSIHCGSRGLGHQIGTEFLKKMAVSAKNFGITLPDRELACAPLDSTLGQAYLGAMRGGINCALANREIITHLTRQAFAQLFPQAELPLLYDVSHNTCKEEWHTVKGEKRRLFVHRKGATRAWGPGHPELPEDLRAVGQPVLIGGTMGTSSYVLAGVSSGDSLAWDSACHGAGRRMSRRQATKQWRGEAVIANLRERGIIVRSPSLRGVAEEAPDAYKDVTDVVDAAEHAGLAKRVARLEPIICIKG